MAAFMTLPRSLGPEAEPSANDLFEHLFNLGGIELVRQISAKKLDLALFLGGHVLAMAFSEFHGRLLPFANQDWITAWTSSSFSGCVSPALFVSDGRLQHAQARDPKLILCFHGFFEVLSDFFDKGCGQRQSSEVKLPI